MPVTCDQLPTISVGDIEMLAMDFTKQLDSGELLTGTPLITEVSTTDLALTNKRVSIAELVINKRSTAIGKAVQCLVSGQQAKTYTIQIVVYTDATPARKFTRYAKFTAI